MSALQGSPIERAERALAAGCDVVLHCNGKLKEMAEIANGIGFMGKLSRRRAIRAASLRGKQLSPEEFADAKINLDSLLG